MGGGNRFYYEIFIYSRCDIIEEENRFSIESIFFHGSCHIELVGRSTHPNQGYAERSTHPNQGYAEICDE